MQLTNLKNVVGGRVDPGEFGEAAALWHCWGNATQNQGDMVFRALTQIHDQGNLNVLNGGKSIASDGNVVKDINAKALAQQADKDVTGFTGDSPCLL